MSARNIGYHTRLDADTAVKIVGGTFGGSIDQETVERLVKSHFTVQVLNSGRCVFVDKEQRRVRLYLNVNPESTVSGKAALKAWTRARAAEMERAEAEEEQQKAELEEALSGLSHEEALRRLKNCN